MSDKSGNKALKYNIMIIKRMIIHDVS